MNEGRKNWTWITTDLKSTDEEWKRAFARWREAGIDAVLPEVFGSRVAFYASKHLPVTEEWLERILPIAKAEGLELHPSLSPEELQQAMAISFERGASGVSLFSAGAMSEEHWESFNKAVRTAG